MVPCLFGCFSNGFMAGFMVGLIGLLWVWCHGGCYVMVTGFFDSFFNGLWLVFGWFVGWYLQGLWWVWGHNGCCVEVVCLRGR